MTIRGTPSSVMDKQGDAMAMPVEQAGRFVVGVGVVRQGGMRKEFPLLRFVIEEPRKVESSIKPEEIQWLFPPFEDLGEGVCLLACRTGEIVVGKRH